jgi:hypothetical protein
MDDDTLDITLKRFEKPDAVREFERGRFEIVTIGGRTLGRAIYEPGWKWSVHVAPSVGAPLCTTEHLGIVLQGRAMVAFRDGRVFEMVPGTLFHVSAEPHDSWVVGNERYVSLHLIGAEQYASR